MKAKRWLVLAIGAMLVMNASAREVRRIHGAKKPIKMEQQFVRCERCGKMIDLRKDPRFMAMRGPEFQRAEFRKGEFRKGDFRKADFRKEELKKHHRHVHR